MYNESSLFVFPSTDEGFGIPLLEAMHFNCSIICSNSSCFPEICGDSAYYFDPKSKNSFVEAIKNCIKNEQETKDKLMKYGSILHKYSKESVGKKVENWAKEMTTI
jgi:glycosyltransferase involved in cell wall biosynthesis